MIKRTPQNSFLDISELAELGQADGAILGNKYEAAEISCYIKVTLYVTLFDSGHKQILLAWLVT